MAGPGYGTVCPRALPLTTLSCTTEVERTWEMDSFREIILLGTVIYMGICAALPFCLCLLFARCQAEIGKSVALMTFGESVGMAVTCAFAVLEMVDAFDSLPWWGATAMRLLMGAVAMLSSLHLARSTHRIILDYENQRSDRDV